MRIIANAFVNESPTQHRPSPHHIHFHHMYDISASERLNTTMDMVVTLGDRLRIKCARWCGAKAMPFRYRQETYNGCRGR